MHGIDGLRLRRLQWLCRRGMKELDVLLERFLKNQSAALKLGAWPELESLLAMEDDHLWHVVQHPETANGQYFALLNQITHGSAVPN